VVPEAPCCPLLGASAAELLGSEAEAWSSVKVGVGRSAGEGARHTRL